MGEREAGETEESRKSRFRRICVFCGSSSGKKSSYSDAALDLGKELVRRKIDLIYGGGSVGLMGLIAQTVHEGGCHVTGVIPKALMPREISGHSVGEVKAVIDMHQRKAEMARHADAFVALPGGYGTLEELLEMITWSQLGIHDKPVGLLNVDGYYNPLLELFEKGAEEGFIKPSSQQIVVHASTAHDLIVRLEEYVPRHEGVAPRETWEMEQLGLGTRKLKSKIRFLKASLHSSSMRQQEAEIAGKCMKNELLCPNHFDILQKSASGCLIVIEKICQFGS